MNLDFPPNFTISIKTLKKATTSSIGTVNLWDNDNNAIGFGSYDHTSNNYSMSYYNGSKWSIVQSETLNLNTEYLWEYSYENGLSTCKVNDKSFTLSRTHYPTKISVDDNVAQINIIFKDLIIKPL